MKTIAFGVSLANLNTQLRIRNDILVSLVISKSKHCEPVMLWLIFKLMQLKNCKLQFQENVEHENFMGLHLADQQFFVL